MSVDIKKQQQSTEQDAEQPNTARSSNLDRLRHAFKQIIWPLTLIVALLMAAAWSAFFLSQSILLALAGLVPVTAGLFLGRRVKQQLILHGLLVGVIGFVFGGLIILGYGLLAEAGYVAPFSRAEADGTVTAMSLGGLLTSYVAFSALAMIPFPAFGAYMAGRAEQRNRDAQEQLAKRGGKLEKPNTVRTMDDLRGLSLPQFGQYINLLYRRNGFSFEDYQFIDKDKHLDLEMTYQGDSYLLRLSVADKVRPGTVQSLGQDMKKRGISKGVVITSTEFSPDAVKAARKNIVLIDGETLFEIAESR